MLSEPNLSCFSTTRRTSRTGRAFAIAPLLCSVCLLFPPSLHHVGLLARTLENSHICERKREAEEQRQHQGRRRGHTTGSNTEHPTAVNQSTVNCKVKENRSETSISSIFTAFANDMELGDVTNILLEACEQHHTATERGDQGETQLRQKLSQLMKENDR